MKPEQLAKEVKNALGQNDFEHALQLLEDHGPTTQIRKEAVLLKGDWHDISRKERLRLLDNTNISIEQGILRNSIFDLADLCLKKAPVIPSSPTHRLLFFLPLGISLLVYFLSSTAYLNAPLEASYQIISDQSRSYKVVVRKKLPWMLNKENTDDYLFKTTLRGPAQGVIAYQEVKLENVGNSPTPDIQRIDFNLSYKKKLKVRFFDPGTYYFRIAIDCEPDHPFCDPSSNLLYSGIYYADTEREVSHLDILDQIYLRPLLTIVPITLFIYIILIFKERILNNFSYFFHKQK